MKKSLFYMGLLFIANTAVIHAQQFYRWTDSKGNIHYTQYAPDESRQQAVNFDPANPPITNVGKDVEALDVMQSSRAVLIEIPKRKPFKPLDREALPSNAEMVGVALDPKSMDYCQTVRANIQTFLDEGAGNIDQILLISQSGERSKLSREEMQKLHKESIDNLEKYCL